MELFVVPKSIPIAMGIPINFKACPLPQQPTPPFERTPNPASRRPQNVFLFAGGIFWKTWPEHWSFTLRLFLGRFILNDVPMLDQDSVLHADNICRNPIHQSAETAESPVHDHEVSLSHDRSGFVLQRWWDALDEIEKTLTARCDMR